jgi:anti-anti-sigma regulatory factor
MTAMPGGHVAVALSGEIDIVAAPAVRKLLAEAVGQAAAGLGALAGASGRARHLPGGFRLVAVPARVLRLLALTGLDRHLAASPAPHGSQPQPKHDAPLGPATGPPAEGP